MTERQQDALLDRIEAHQRRARSVASRRRPVVASTWAAIGLSCATAALFLAAYLPNGL